MHRSPIPWAKILLQNSCIPDLFTLYLWYRNKIYIMKSFKITYTNRANNNTHDIVIRKKNIGDARELAWKPSLFNRGAQALEAWDDQVSVKVTEI